MWNELTERWLVCLWIFSFFIQSMTGGCHERHNQFTSGWGGEADLNIKAKIKIRREHRSISAFKRNQVFFLSPKNNGKKFNLTSSYLTTPRKSARKTISLYQPNSNSFGNYPCCLTLLVSKCVWKLWVLIIDFLYSIEIIFNIR